MELQHALKFLVSGLPTSAGLMTVAAMLREIGKRLVDTNVERLRDRDLDWAACAGERHAYSARLRWRPIIERCVHAGCELLWAGPMPAAFQLKI